MTKTNDWLGGYTLKELLDTAPVSKSPAQIKKESGKRGIVSNVVGAPFRLVVALVKLPLSVVRKLVAGVVRAVTEIVKLPLRLLRSLTSPLRSQ